MGYLSVLLVALASINVLFPVTAQVVYATPTQSYNPATTTTYRSGTPSYHFSSFAYTGTDTVRIATPNPTTTAPTTFAKPFSVVSSIFTNASSRTWPNWTPVLFSAPTDAADPYGNAAYSSLWYAVGPTNFSRGIYSTTASPTPVPTSELVYPPPLLFGPQTPYLFPEDFIFGVAGSASQCEGAVADEGKAPAFTDVIADLLALTGAQTSNNFVTNEHYYLYQQDIERFAAIGAKYYSFSIPWTRIMPFALPGTPINSEAIQHYSDVIDFVWSKGMKPVVTLTHYDTPLQFYGGGSEYVLQYAGTRSYYGAGFGLNLGYSNSSFEEAYVNYATLVMAQYADRVPVWITFNEPQNGSPDGAAVYNVLKAHARVVHFYRETLQGTGKVSLKMGVNPGIPLKPENPSFVNATEQFTDLYVNTYLNPLAAGLDYPDAFKWAIQDYVPLTTQDLEYMNGTIDFVALDAYVAPVISPLVSDFAACAQNNATSNTAYRFPICLNMSTVDAQGWALGYNPNGSTIDFTAPEGLRVQLNYVWDRFKLPVLISEFGLELPSVPGNVAAADLFNVPQSEYILAYLGAMLKAIWEDGVHVMGALVWNWGDDWEFGYFDTGFGLQHVNHTTQQRTYRRSFFDVVDFVSSRQVAYR